MPAVVLLATPEGQIGCGDGGLSVIESPPGMNSVYIRGLEVLGIELLKESQEALIVQESLHSAELLSASHEFGQHFDIRSGDESGIRRVR